MPNLLAGESQLRTANVVWAGPEGPRPGTLTLTNQALIFEGPVPQGPPGPRPGPFRGPPGRFGPPRGFGAPGPGRPMLAPGVLRIPLWRCRQAVVRPGPEGNVLEVDLLQRSPIFRLPEPEAWAAAINQARATAPPPPPGAMGGGPGGPGRAPMPRCEYCGNLSPTGSPKCTSCGASF